MVFITTLFWRIHGVIRRLRKIEAKMLESPGKKIILQEKPYQNKKQGLFQEKDEYKLELIEGLQDGYITFYTQGRHRFV